MSLTVTLDLTDAQIAILEKVASEQNTTIGQLVHNFIHKYSYYGNLINHNRI